jgi:DinB superfamily
MTHPRDLNSTIEALAAFPARLRDAFHCFPPDRTGWKPPAWDGIPSERLTAIEQVCHVYDIEIEGYRVRFDRTRTQSAPVLPDLPGESMARERHYAAADPTKALQDFAVARAQTVDIIRGFSAAELDRVAVFEGQRTTLAGLVHFLCSHDYQHLAGLQWLLAKLDPRAAVSPS